MKWILYAVSLCAVASKSIAPWPFLFNSYTDITSKCRLSAVRWRHTHAYHTHLSCKDSPCMGGNFCIDGLTVSDPITISFPDSPASYANESEVTLSGAIFRLPKAFPWQRSWQSMGETNQCSRLRANFLWSENNDSWGLSFVSQWNGVRPLICHTRHWPKPVWRLVVLQGTLLRLWPICLWWKQTLNLGPTCYVAPALLVLTGNR